MNNVINLVLLDEFLVVALIADVETGILAWEFNLGVAQVSCEDCALWANFLTDGLGEGDTNLSIGSSH